MEPRIRLAFLLLIVVQAAHSFEEFANRLFDVLAPARFVSGLFSDNLARGFVIANTLLVLFFVWCYVARVRPGHPSGRAIAWAWSLLELGNGIGHSVMAAWTGGYFPGVATAPLLIVVSFYLLKRLSETRSAPGTRR
jgi:hypothetical protein